MKSFYKINCCRICGNKNLKKIPLMLLLCKNCSLVQLSHTVHKEILYKNYWYESGINLTMKTHLKEITTTGSFLLKKNDDIKVLDIGCNDGTLLNFYPKKFKKYGIDPSQIVKKIDKKKINVINDFFPPQKKNIITKLKFDLITSIAMFYDLQNPNLFVKKIKTHLEKNGIWIFELSYLIDMLKLNSFDTICHEHLEYYSIHSLDFLLKKYKLKMFNISMNTINGGSIRCFVTHSNNNMYDIDKNLKKIKKLIVYEKKIQIKKSNVYEKFEKNIKDIKKKLNSKIDLILKQKKKIFILGASTKGNTILQFLNIDNKKIPFAIERNKQKIGAQTIGSNIKIIGEKFTKDFEPDYKLVLPWHFKSEIIKRELNYIKKGGKLIFPLPKLLIINKKNYLKHAK